MNKVAAFIKKYWITFCIFAGLVFLYIIVTEKELVNPYIFTYTYAIKKYFD